MGVTTAMKETETTVPRRPRKGTAVQAFLGLTDAPEVSRSTRQKIAHSILTRRGKTNTEKVIELLNEALASTVVGILRYKHHYFMTGEISARRERATFFRHVTDEQAHADQLAERIEQLGGQALVPFERLLNRSHAEQVEWNSLAEMIMADLVAEQSAIHNYRKLIVSVGDDDQTTRQVLERILAQEEAHAENLVGLLRD